MNRKFKIGDQIVLSYPTKMKGIVGKIIEPNNLTLQKEINHYEALSGKPYYVIRLEPNQFFLHEVGRGEEEIDFYYPQNDNKHHNTPSDSILLVQDVLWPYGPN